MNDKILVPKELLTEIANILRYKNNITDTLTFPGEFISKIPNIHEDYAKGKLISYHNHKISNIRDYAFYDCELLKIIDISLVVNIGYSAFDDCTSLNTVILRSETMCVLNNTNAFTDTPIESGTGYIYVPRALVDTYKTATNWSTYANQIRAIEDYPDICG